MSCLLMKRGTWEGGHVQSLHRRKHDLKYLPPIVQHEHLLCTDIMI